MDRLLIVDGSNLLFQMFFGMPSRIIGANGKPVHGVIGFTGALFKIIKMTLSTHVIVLFDGEHENDRAKVDGNYKANRTDYLQVDEGENPFSQLEGIYTVLDNIKIPYYETKIYETDDVIASYVHTYGEETDIVISSFDSDFFQLISDRVHILRYRGNKTVVCTPEYVRSKYGIEPSDYADFKCLTGDSADNIGGVKGVGPKTAAELINEWGSLENIIANAQNIKKPSVSEAVKSSGELLMKNRKLIKLLPIAPIPYKIQDLSYCLPEVSTVKLLKDIGIL